MHRREDDSERRRVREGPYVFEMIPNDGAERGEVFEWPEIPMTGLERTRSEEGFHFEKRRTH